MNDLADDTLTTLLDIVERDRDERCLRIREEAQQEARRLVQEARSEARARVTEAIRDARRRAQARIDDARAALTTEARQRRQEASRALLERAWAMLPDALAERWGSTEGRKLWIEALIDLAGTSLPLGTWHVSHPPDLSDDDRERIVARIADVSDDAPELEPSDEVTAGLRVCVGATCLDGTARGLLADRHAVEGRLLSEMIGELDSVEEAAP